MVFPSPDPAYNQVRHQQSVFVFHLGTLPLFLTSFCASVTSFCPGEQLVSSRWRPLVVIPSPDPACNQLVCERWLTRVLATSTLSLKPLQYWVMRRQVGLVVSSVSLS